MPHLCWGRRGSGAATDRTPCAHGLQCPPRCGRNTKLRAAHQWGCWYACYAQFCPQTGSARNRPAETRPTPPSPRTEHLMRSATTRCCAFVGGMPTTERRSSKDTIWLARTVTGPDYTQSRMGTACNQLCPEICPAPRGGCRLPPGFCPVQAWSRVAPPMCGGPRRCSLRGLTPAACQFEAGAARGAAHGMCGAARGSTPIRL